MVCYCVLLQKFHVWRMAQYFSRVDLSLANVRGQNFCKIRRKKIAALAVPATHVHTKVQISIVL